MKHSEQINEIAPALVAAQAEMKNPAFDSQNPHYKNKFASLAAVRNTVVPALSSKGISMLQELRTTSEDGIACHTYLIHESGQWMEFGPFVMTPTKTDPQGFGSAATYCKRYALMAVCGIVGDEDDDAEAAVVRMSPQKRTKIIKALKSDDAYEVLETWEELDQDEQKALWAELRSDERSQIKAQLATARSERDSPDPKYVAPTPLTHERTAKEEARKQANG